MAAGTTSLKEFVDKLNKTHAVWMMVPAAAVDPTLKALIPLLAAEDIVIDGGNSYYHDDIRRASELKAKGHPLCGRWDQRRCLGIGAGLLPDDRRG